VRDIPVLAQPPQAGEDQVPNRAELAGQAVVQIHEQLLVEEQLAHPERGVDPHDLREALERAVDEDAAEVAGGGGFGIEMELLGVVRERGDQQVVRLRHGAADHVYEMIADLPIFVPAA
jgi:hypothetical protein